MFDHRITEGIIEYAVSYPYMDEDDFLLSFMPKTMSLQFKDNVMTTELSAGLGMFKTNFITNSNDLNLKHLVKLASKKMYARFDASNIHEVLDEYPEYTIIELPETEMIAGHRCKKALIIYDEVETREFYIYYTDDIKFQNPNWCTPFKEIEGMLMAYEIKQFNITTRMEAIDVLETSVEEQVFEVPEDYKEVSFSRLEQEVADVFIDFD